jgi:hypothetical protein
MTIENWVRGNRQNFQKELMAQPKKSDALLTDSGGGCHALKKRERRRIMSGKVESVNGFVIID